MILITGGTGFLGSQVLRQLIHLKKEVRCIYRKRILSNVPVHLAKEVDWQPADLLDVTSLEDALEDVEEVYHCAGLVSFDPGDRDKLYQTNVEGTANLVNACLEKGIRKFVHVSSVAALGRKQSGPIDEKQEWQNSRRNSFYAGTKHDGEMEVWRAMAEGLPAVIVNPSILVGSSPCWEDAFAELIKKCYTGFPWYTKGVNGFVDVSDAARAMVMLADHNITGERFVLNGDNWSYEKLFRSIHHHLQTGVKLKYAAPWIGEIIWRLEKLGGWLSHHKPAVTRETAKTARLKVYYNSDKLKEALPAFQYTPLEETISATCRAYFQYRYEGGDPGQKGSGRPSLYQMK